MGSLLLINACMRGKCSHTLKLARRFPDAYRAAHPDTVITKRDFYAIRLQPQHPEILAERDALWNADKLEQPILEPVWQLATVDKLITAAPFWDMSFLAVLKIYLEHISVTSLASGYSKEGAIVGLCWASKLPYITTRGGNYVSTPVEVVTPVLKTLYTMYGIPGFQYLDTGRLNDIRNDREVLLTGATRRAGALAEVFRVRPHILLLTTRDTIASLPTAKGPTSGLDGKVLTGLFPQGTTDRYGVTIRDIPHLNPFSIQPEEWQTIACHALENRVEYSGIVTTYGIDTMAYTVSVLFFMLRGISIPVVLTGAQLPMVHPLSDGMGNLRTALAMTVFGVPGVFLAFDRKVILGCRAVETHITDFDVFESVNWPLAANVDGRGLQIHREAIPAPTGVCVLRGKLCGKVLLIEFIPGLDPETFDALLQMHYRSIVIEAFGAGELHFVRRDLIAKFQVAARAGATMVVCFRHLYEPSDFSVYEMGRRALAQGVIQDRDMTIEAAVAKLIWVLEQTGDPEIIRDYMERSLAGKMA